MPDTATLVHRALDSDTAGLATLAAADSDVRQLLLSRDSVSAAQASLSRMIGRGLQLRLPLLDAEFSIHLSEEPDAAWPQPVMLAGPSGMLEIADGVRWIRALTGIDLDAAAGDTREWLQAAAVGRLAATPLAAMDRMVPVARIDGSDVALLRLGLHGARHSLSTHARAPAATWLEILSGAEWSQRRATPSACRDLVVETTLLLARHRLPAFAVRRLAAGDIVLPDSPNFTCDGKGSVRLGDRQFQVRCQAPGSLEIIALENKLEAEELDENVDAQPAVIDQLDALPLTLRFELGKISITLAELRALGPQAILSVKDGSAASLAIVCSGRTLGRGEAVDVDGVLGIRITHWGSTC
ncbi:type III secretion system cytoplasmic ring protein SctQ [Collimonas sp.]|jgi:type III secretion protein Q|uniref:type III secretion system cytoplasmic ring protein SctQ n=1 Tax=Collimonas sp. TaxID=1963772 RepID=UPI002BB84166|nr:type III secretion system cytoplasmic ring protein SctQ [Collimonas sp.]HWW05974.1 type III secretion system cytoplasmic ring protein SctQ [Collimonas sp.]